NIAANQQQQYESLCHVVGRTDLLDDPRFADREARKAHRAELNRELNEALSTRPALEWEGLLAAAGVPAARVLSVAEAVSLEQLAYRGFFADLPFPEAPPAGVAAPDPRHGDDGRRLRVSSNGLLVDGDR